jgi:radical SAM protein with 4Fe4S-binding SPASM domain
VDRLWVSLDGPPAVNDDQRGAGTFADVVAGLTAVDAARTRLGTRKTQLGVTFAVTPENHGVIAETFLEAIDRSLIDNVSIEYQTYLRPDQLRAYEALLHDRFGVDDVRFAQGMVRAQGSFAGIDAARVAAQIERVRDAYQAAGKGVVTRPRVTTEDNTRAHFDGRFDAMRDHHDRCYFPWMYAEVSSSGGVTPCHTFYDLTFGNVNDQPLLEIWRSERFEDARRRFREGLLPVCHACCLYHTDPIPITRPAKRTEGP